MLPASLRFPFFSAPLCFFFFSSQFSFRVLAHFLLSKHDLFKISELLMASYRPQKQLLYCFLLQTLLPCQVLSTKHRLLFITGKDMCAILHHVFIYIQNYITRRVNVMHHSKDANLHALLRPYAHDQHELCPKTH